MMRRWSCWLVLWLAACGAADRTDQDAAAPPPAAPPAAALPVPAVAATPSALPTPAPRVDAVAVRVGGEAELDACGGWSRIRKPDGAAAGAVEVRGGPGSRYAVVDRLSDGAQFYTCDSSEGWSGIVYPQSGEAGVCGVSTPVAERQPYAGPCRSGWIPSEFEELLAG